MNAQQVFDQFMRYRRQLERRGKVSPFDRLEMLALQLFVEWMVDHQVAITPDPPTLGVSVSETVKSKERLS